jgi:Lrp/AsnC family leucine-responsive transcriptional regulator
MNHERILANVARSALLFGVIHHQEPTERMKTANSKLDETDRRILTALQRDGRLSIVDLAERVGLSATPCLRRVKRLEQAGVIKGYTAIVDPAATGRGLQAFVQVNLENHAEDTVTAFQRAIMARPEVVACYAISGEFDYLLQVMVPDLEAYSEFALKALLRMPGVKDTRSSFAMGVLKPFTIVPVS